MLPPLLYLCFLLPLHSCSSDGVDGKEVLLTFDEPQEIEPDIEDLKELGDLKECGKGGDESEGPKQWPWLAALVVRANKEHFCGGALITRRHVLTAAHCLPQVVTSENVVVRLGEYDFGKEGESEAEDLSIAELRVHEEFDPLTKEHDIAVIKLSKPVLYGPHVRPVCLPPPGPRFANLTAVSAGWGATSYNGPKADVLMEVLLPIWEQERCRASFTQTVYNTTMCAAGYDGGKDSCQGDSGGPLMLRRQDGRWMTVGVVSWGIKCALKGRAGLFTRVNDYLGWLYHRIHDV